MGPKFLYYYIIINYVGKVECFDQASRDKLCSWKNLYYYY